jgi:hypothetical protein
MLTTPKPEKCSCEVRIAGVNFPRYKRCSRNAVTVEAGKPVCRQHSADAKAARVANGDAARERQKVLYYAHLKSRKNERKP